MSHPPQSSVPPRQFEPQYMPPSKRARISPGASSNPGSPYPNHASPNLTTPAATPTNMNSPTSLNHNSQYHQPNGRPAPAAMTLTMPSPAPSVVPAQTLASPQPQTPGTSTHAPYSTAMLAPIAATSASSVPQVITNMGPPAITPMASSYDATRQTSKGTSARAADAYEMDDMLAGTGIDLVEEEELLNSYGPRRLLPGSRGTFFGAGPLNQPPEPTDGQTQEEFAVECADRVWNEAAARLAKTRSQEDASNFLDSAKLHIRMHDIAQKFDLTLNLDTRSDGSKYAGRLMNPVDFPKPEVKIQVRSGPDGAIVSTMGSFIPPESMLIDQIVLLSQSTKHRLRELVGDANRAAITRQKTAHGQVPPEWVDVADVQPPAANGSQNDGQRTGAESAVSPRTIPFKRSADALSGSAPTVEVSADNLVVDAMGARGKAARSVEEGRLIKRLKKAEQAAEKDKEAADGSSRTGSVAPGTPRSVAPEQVEVKAPTKKESKKSAKATETSSTMVNQTLGLFVGSKKKKYSWMNAAGPGSGASTPRLQGSAAPGTPGGMSSLSHKASRGLLTKPGVMCLGQFREDSDKGKNIQLRDWVAALQAQHFNSNTVQQAYDIMDVSARGSVESSTAL
ncbi:hypothetical protein GGR54DRAFT_582978 [Hypoxylon sp. NC1633]|nr:hypothetical protein GGR54DRAFT_582978 [Hypoxylon sp. NC1633]